MQTNAVRVSHLGRVGNDLSPVAGPDDDGCHHESRSGGVVVEQPEDRRSIEMQAEFFVCLAQGGFDRRFVAIDLAAGQSPLTRVAIHACGSSTQQERGSTGHPGHATVQAGHVAGNTA